MNTTSLRFRESTGKLTGQGDRVRLASGASGVIQFVGKEFVTVVGIDLNPRTIARVSASRIITKEDA